jgi:hypothetical protein
VLFVPSRLVLASRSVTHPSTPEQPAEARCPRGEVLSSGFILTPSSAASASGWDRSTAHGAGSEPGLALGDGDDDDGSARTLLTYVVSGGEEADDDDDDDGDGGW